MVRKLIWATVLMALPLSSCTTPAAQVSRLFSVAELAAAARQKVVAAPSSEGGGSLRVTLEPGLSESEMYDKPTFVIVPVTFSSGTIDVDVMSRTLPDAPSFARGFVGIAYRISEGADRFEAVYLRPANGRSLNPPAPRDQRAVQWFSYPEWLFDRLRESFPAGSYEGSADIAPQRRAKLQLKIDGRKVSTFVDGEKTLEVGSLVDPQTGPSDFGWTSALKPSSAISG